MKFSFDPALRLITVRVVLTGPWGNRKFVVALDTGASRTCASEMTLRSIGIDTNLIPRSKTIHTASGTSAYGEASVIQLGALGRIWDNPTIAFSKLGSTHLDGLLGLDFFRGRILTIDSVRGTIALVRPWRRLFQR